MTLRTESGTIITKTALLAAATQQPQPEAKFRLGAHVYETFALVGESEENFEGASRLKHKAGDILTQSQIDALFPAATATSISPATGVPAGNTTVTITGTNLVGVRGVTFDGVAATAVKVLSPTKVRCKTPAHAAGAVAVVVQDDNADVTKPAFFTYAT